MAVTDHDAFDRTEMVSTAPATRPPLCEPLPHHQVASIAHQAAVHVALSQIRTPAAPTPSPAAKSAKGKTGPLVILGAIVLLLLAAMYVIEMRRGPEPSLGPAMTDSPPTTAIDSTAPTTATAAPTTAVPANSPAGQPTDSGASQPAPTAAPAPSVAVTQAPVTTVAPKPVAPTTVPPPAPTSPPTTVAAPGNGGGNGGGNSPSNAGGNGNGQGPGSNNAGGNGNGNGQSKK